MIGSNSRHELVREAQLLFSSIQHAVARAIALHHGEEELGHRILGRAAYRRGGFGHVILSEDLDQESGISMGYQLILEPEGESVRRSEGGRVREERARPSQEKGVERWKEANGAPGWVKHRGKKRL